MKIKNIVLLVLFIIAQKIDAAVVSIYNRMNQPLGPQIFWCVSSCNSFNKQEKWERIGLLPANDPGLNGAESKQRFNSGMHPLTRLRWVEPNTNQAYEAMIPSSTTMLMGTIILHENGWYSINFDRDGSSDKKVRNIKAMPIP